MRRIRMHESGNRYLAIDCRTTSVPPADLQALCEEAGRQGGKLIVLSRAEVQGDVRMELYHADGSVMQGQGDGVCGVASYLFEHGSISKPRLSIESPSRTWHVELQTQDNRVEKVRIDLGPPILEAERIPTRLPGNPPLEMPMTWPDTMHNVNCVGFGEAHAVVFARELSDDLVKSIGPEMERHPLFPEHTNVEFVKVHSRNEVSVRLWGKGDGERPSSSSGACAVIVAGVLTGRTGRVLTVRMPGGTVEVRWDRQTDEHVQLIGPPAEVVLE